MQKLVVELRNAAAATQDATARVSAIRRLSSGRLCRRSGSLTPQSEFGLPRTLPHSSHCLASGAQLSSGLRTSSQSALSKEDNQDHNSLTQPRATIT
jgi:hypothetical protein